MISFSGIVLQLALHRVVFAAECSSSCGTEFNTCWEFHCGNGQSNEQAYATCRSELDDGFHKLADAGCISGCIDTEAMSELSSGTCRSKEDGPDGGQNRGGVCNPGTAIGAALATGCFKLNSRQFHVQLPTGTGSFPVFIGLHGAGGSGSNQLHAMKELGPAVTQSYILVAPDGGAGNTWNIYAEESKTDDAGFVSSTLVNTLAAASNVKPDSFVIGGMSNGAALTNRILIESDNSKIVAGITDVSQLNTKQWHSGSFHVGGTSNAYTTPKNTLAKRSLLQITGGQDNIIPAAGGQALIPGNVQFVAWEVSAFQYAKAWGYTGEQASLAEDTATVASVSYLNGQVQAYNCKQMDHSGGFQLAAGKTVIVDFLKTQASSSSASSSTGTKEGTNEVTSSSTGTSSTASSSRVTGLSVILEVFCVAYFSWSNSP